MSGAKERKNHERHPVHIKVKTVSAHPEGCLTAFVALEEQSLIKVKNPVLCRDNPI